MTVFLNTTDKNGLINICESLCFLGDGAISGDAVLLKQFTNYINIGVAEVRSRINRVDRSWKSEYYNYTNAPIAPIAIVSGQFDYEIPVASVGANVATFLRMNHIYYVLGEERQYLTPMDRREQYNATATGTPTAYYFDGKSIYFDIAPDADFLADVTTFYADYSRLDDPFISTDTTQQPGFIGTYHHILAYKASSLYFLGKDPSLSRMYSTGRDDTPGMFESGRLQVEKDIVRMNGDKRHIMTPSITPYI
jgi:hypothetical protein